MGEILGKSDKSEWRSRMTAVRDSLTPADRENRSARLCRLVENEVLSFIRGRLDRSLNLCAYAPFRSEASPLSLMEGCWNKGDQVYAPRIIPGEEGMELRKVEDMSNWIPGKWGVPEPDPSRTVLMDGSLALDVVLVPGIAYNIEGVRLGYGGGYYDRLYADRKPASTTSGTLWIGFAFSDQVVTEPLPLEPHDLRLNGMATEERIIWFNEGEA